MQSFGFSIKKKEKKTLKCKTLFIYIFITDFLDNFICMQFKLKILIFIKYI